VYPVSFIDKTQLENGDKVILPPSALDRLSQLRIDYPMLFQITNPKENKTSHCGVLEFVADEGHAYIPYWMMQNLLLQEGDLVKFKSISLSKGTYVKLRPHTKDFLDISNPKAVLEMTLRNYSCLTKDDAIMVNYNNKRYFIDIVETQPGDAVTIIETDCEVDFAPPLDYVEPERVQQPQAAVGTAFSGGSVLQGKGKAGAKKENEKEEQQEEEEERPSFIAFAGTAKRLDGKAQETSYIKPPSPKSENGADQKKSLSRTSSKGSRAGKRISVEANPDLPKPPPRAADAIPLKNKKEDKEEEEKKPAFQAFSGKSNRLC
jgi:ubiquitin fusion degradation protein 1